MISALAWLFSSCANEKGPLPVDCGSNPVVIVSMDPTSALCNEANGVISITASGGSGTYTFSIDGTNFQSEGMFSGVSAGIYNILVKDENSCEATGTVVVETVSGISMSTEKTESGCGISSGSVTITLTGAVAPIQYKMGNGTYQDGNSFTGLEPGNYDVFARDADGCIVTATVKIVTNISLENDIMPLLATNCALSGCHDGKSGLPNWTVKTTVINNASRIKQKTGSGEMPPGDATITGDEIERIACWVDDGALNN